MAPEAVETDSLHQIPLGKAAIWWFLASEIMVFGGLITSYVLMMFAHGGFAEQAVHVKWKLGALNTLVLLTSSMTMILALASARKKDLEKTRMFLGITVLLGLTFLVIKIFFEYIPEIGEGFTPASGMFWSFYFGMTGLHGVHVFGGIVANFCLFIYTMRKVDWSLLERRVEYAGLYWHFVDVVWIFLFPLLYLT